MKRERLAEIKAIHGAALKGPYRWNLNLKHKQIELQSIVCNDGWNETILDFRRWGMGGAKVCFNNHKGLIEPAENFAKPIPRREHHKDWCQTVDHPDANLLAESWQIIKELLDEVERLRGAIVEHQVEHSFSGVEPTDFGLWALLDETTETGLAQAKGAAK